MTIAILIGLSIAWGGVIVCFAAGLQRLGLSGVMRQILWRATAVMLAAPFVAAGVFAMLGPEIVEPVWTWGEAGAAETPIVLDAAMLERASQNVIVRNDSILPDMSALEMVLSLIGLGWFIRAVMARRAAMELKSVTRDADLLRSQSALESAQRWSQMFGLKKTPKLMLMGGDFSPFTQGVIRPVVYLPHGLEAKLLRTEMDLVVGHELMHVKRGDAMWRPIERLIADILWFNPFAWFVRSELERARELACDEAMLKAAAPAKDYARALVSVARFAAGLPAQAPAAAMFPFNKDKALPERVKAAAGGAGGSSVWAMVGLAAFVLAGLPLAIAQGAGAPKTRLPIPEFTATVVTSPKAEVSSHYGKRKDPITGQERFHKGVDVKAPKGTPIYAPADAEVVHADRAPGYGNLVKLRFNKEWYGKFGQMSEVKVVEGQRVRAGDVIGLVGSPGRSTGPHVHIEVLGPSMSYDQTGELAAFNPVHLGLAPSSDEELNAAQIREMGVVLPDPPPAATLKTARKVVPVPPVAPVPPTVTALNSEEMKSLEPGAVLEFTSDDGTITKIVKSKDGKTVTKTINHVHGEHYSDEKMAEMHKKLEVEHDVIIHSDHENTVIELDGDGDMIRSYAFVTRDGDLSEEELDELRREARERAEEAREMARDLRQEAEERRQEAMEARREAAEAWREAEKERRESEKEHHEDLLKDQSYHLDGGLEEELFQSLGLEDLIGDSIELSLQEMSLALDDVFIESGGAVLHMEALNEAIAEIDEECDDLHDDLAELTENDFETQVEKRAVKSAIKALTSVRNELDRKRSSAPVELKSQH